MRTQKRKDALRAPRFFRLAPALLLTIFTASSHAGSSAVRDSHDSRISVTSVAGDVDVTMAGKAVTVSPDATVLLPARIVTGHDGNVGLTQSGTNIDIANDTDVEIPAEAVDGNLVARLVQHSGNVFYDVAPRDLGKLRVETPFLVAVIKGTQFNVAVNEDGTTISLFEGSLEIRTPDDSEVIELNAGEIAIRSLIDDSIHVIGMNDDRVAIPPPVAPAAAEEAAATTAPVDNAAATADNTVAPRAEPNDGVAARAEAHVETLAAVSPALRAVELEVRSIDVIVESPKVAESRGVDLGRGVVDLAIDVGGATVDTKLDADVTLDAPSVDVGLERGLGVDAGVELDVIDVGTRLDLGTGVVDSGADLTLDTGSLDLGLDIGDASLDLALDVDQGKNADVGLDLGLDTGGTVDVDVVLDPDIDLGLVEPTTPEPPRSLPSPPLGLPLP